jgi:hypothetical protein
MYDDDDDDETQNNRKIDTPKIQEKSQFEIN